MLLTRSTPARLAFPRKSPRPWIISKRSYAKKLKVHPTTPARTRFAPSPTGFLHLGGLRTALYNYLLAKNTGGQFLLRIEDTDQARTVSGAEESLQRTLSWAGLTPDESPTSGGLHGPYKQSERLPIYRQHAEDLVQRGQAYRCFCSAERLESLRNQGGAGVNRAVGSYDRACTHISDAESQERVAKGERHAIRLLTPDEYPKVNDLVFGTVQFHRAPGAKAAAGPNVFAAQATYDDPVLLKSDGYPTYHLASVVDDHLMQISHVVRGEEWLPSTPKHLAIYDAFGWDAPKFAHLPLLTNLEGKKLSKRENDANVDMYIKEGYLPEALLNFVALMGWGAPVTTRDQVFTLEEMAKAFRLDKVTKGSTAVAPEKLIFLNKKHLSRLPDQGADWIYGVVKPALEERFGKGQASEMMSHEEDPSVLLGAEYVKRVYALVHERLRRPTDLPESCDYFWRNPHEGKSGPELSSKLELFWAAGMPVTTLLRHFRAVETWDETNINNAIDATWKEVEGKDEVRGTFTKKDLLMSVRVCVCGGKMGADIGKTVEIIGRARVIARIEACLETEKKYVESRSSP
ncbi:Glutamate--tRNA ligase mitochondrial [Saitoella coloradoensis]